MNMLLRLLAMVKILINGIIFIKHIKDEYLNR